MGKSGAIIHRYVQCWRWFYNCFIKHAVVFGFFASAETCTGSGLHVMHYDVDNISVVQQKFCNATCLRMHHSKKIHWLSRYASFIFWQKFLWRG